MSVSLLLISPLLRTAERQILQAMLEKLEASIRGAILNLDPTNLDLNPVGIISQHSVMNTCSNAQLTLRDYAPWSAVESNLVSALHKLDEFDRLIQEGSWDNELELLCKLSIAKCHVGAVLSCLLCPSPVDPIVTAITKYTCFQHQVRGSGPVNGKLASKAVTKTTTLQNFNSPLPLFSSPPLTFRCSTPVV